MRSRTGDSPETVLRLPDGYSASRSGGSGAPALNSEHVQSYGSGPGLLVGAQRLACERLEVLGEAPLCNLSYGLAPDVRGPGSVPGTY